MRVGFTSPHGPISKQRSGKWGRNKQLWGLRSLKWAFVGTALVVVVVVVVAAAAGGGGVVVVVVVVVVRAPL